MKKIRGFTAAYLIFLAVCILLSAVFLVYVHFVVKEYDSAQPERAVEQYMTQLKAYAQDGSISEKLGFAALCTNRYENNDPAEYASVYSGKIRDAALTYEYNAAESSELQKTYSILADDVPVGSLSIQGENSRTSLFFFSMADWSVQGYEPIIADTVYNLTVYRPEGTRVFINGTEPAEDELDAASEITAFNLQGLLHEPVIEYRNSDNAIITYTTENNIVKPALYNYRLELPVGIEVGINGKPAVGEPADDGQLVYNVCEMEQPKVSVADVNGVKYTFIGDFEADFHSFAVTVPAEYKVSVNGRDVEEFGTVRYTEHADAAVLLDKAGVQLKDTKTCSFTLLSEDASVMVTDESGAEKPYLMSQPALIIDAEVGSDTIPEDIAQQLDIMDVAKTWSKFMTDDLEGDTHGLAEVQKYFIKDSDYYRYAAEWATGPDIKFTSPHTLDSFTGEKISNFIQYNENCFSCEVYFEKNMSLIYEDRFAGARTDVFHSIMYFLYTDDTPDNGIDDPHWAIAVMHDVI